MLPHNLNSVSLDGKQVLEYKVKHYLQWCLRFVIVKRVEQAVQMEVLSSGCQLGRFCGAPAKNIFVYVLSSK